MELSDIETTARDYYDSDDAEEFYSQIWGGEDIHIGLYRDADESISDASRRTVSEMAKHLPTRGCQVLDLGAGYGGAARFLSTEFDCRVDCLNLSEAQNERNRRLTLAAGLEPKIKVIAGSFEDLPFTDGSYQVVWSQDAFLHSGRREQVLSEATRMLQPGGRLIFTDIMQSDDCPDGVLQPILDRIHLANLGSPAFYRRELARLGMTETLFRDETDQLVNHYGHVLMDLESRESDLDGVVSDAYIQNMKAGLRRWVEGGRNGYLTWGIWVFEKKAA